MKPCFIENVIFNKNLVPLPPRGLRVCYSVYPTKRESGENPEQTRYCKFHATF
jgi:hypothetical protein